MNYLLDTNILLIYLRSNELAEKIESRYNLLSDSNTAVVSVVSLGEINSIALQNNWGENKIDKLNKLVNRFLIADINAETIIARYAEIDAFSQGKHPFKQLNCSSRNMGKNDLWIAATASVLDAALVTSDKDFEHLNTHFIKLEWIDVSGYL